MLSDFHLIEASLPYKVLSIAGSAEVWETLRCLAMGVQELLSLGNLDVTRDWGHAREYVSCMWLMLQQQQPADFVISTGTNTTVRCPETSVHKRSSTCRGDGQRKA